MCGIAGFVNHKEEKQKDLENMLSRIIHRGPDGSGMYFKDDVALGHRRLSIIDLEGGSQPMFNEDNRVSIVFNGEIYNYQELKEELLKCNHTFKTNSDTEVIIHGYEEYGYDIVKKLRGMFAFVLYDESKKELFGARDHFGMKPFYYYLEDNIFLFSSEIKAFLDHSDFNKQLNQEVLNEYLRFNYTPTTETFFKNVYKLEPGHYFTYKDDNLEINPYFEITFDEKEEEFSSLVDKISECMKDSVSKHMISDVEVGSFLSSGIDSSYIVSLARPDKTYTVGYDIPKYDEISYAKELADLLKIKNISKKISKQEYFDNLPKIIYHMDEPLADPAAIALYFVAELASKDVKVVLSGEGADELFGGYNTYNEEGNFGFYNKIPFCIRNVIARICRHLPEGRGINFFTRRGLKLSDYYIGVNSVFTEKEVKKYLKNKNINHSNKELIKPIFDKQKGKSSVIQKQAVDLHFWFANDILQKADKMTMAHSIEGRMPFCDKEVFTLARTIPDHDKIKEKTTKYALRMAAKKDIPNESYNKKKLGFPVPLREWIKEDDIYNQIKESFNSNISQELFENKKILKLLEDHKTGKKDCYKKIWTIYTFLVWYHEFFEA